MAIRINKSVGWFLHKSKINIKDVLDFLNEDDMFLKDFLSYQDARSKFLDCFLLIKEPEFNRMKVSEFIDFFENDNQDIRGVLFLTPFKNFSRHDDPIDYIEESLANNCKNKLIYISNLEMPNIPSRYVVTKTGKVISEEILDVARALCNNKIKPGKYYKKELLDIGIDTSKKFESQVNTKPPEFLMFLAELFKVKREESIKMRAVIANQWR